MHSVFVKTGQVTRVTKKREGDITNRLEPAIYTASVDDDGFFLEYVGPKFELPEKVYGDNPLVANRVLQTYEKATSNLGILLTGMKGTGKTLLSKAVANAALDISLPVIQIHSSLAGVGFFNFIESLGDCVLIFDEFGKTYSKYTRHDGPSQESLLPLFDGLSQGKRLHILTENSVEMINDYYKNRPGRIFYHFRFERMSNAVVVEYLQDKKIPEKVIDEIIEAIKTVSVLTMDTLTAIVNEWKRYKEPIKDILKVINVTSSHSQGGRFILRKLIGLDGKEMLEFKDAIARSWDNNDRLEWRSKPSSDSQPQPSPGFRPRSDYVDLRRDEAELISAIDNKYVYHQDGFVFEIELLLN